MYPGSHWNDTLLLNGSFFVSFLAVNDSDAGEALIDMNPDVVESEIPFDVTLVRMSLLLFPNLSFLGTEMFTYL